MATTGKLNGTIMLLYVDGTAISSTTSHSLSYEMATRDATTKDSQGYEEVLESTRSWTIDFDGMEAFNDTYSYEELRSLISQRSQVTLLFSSQVSGDPQWSGAAYLTSVSLEAPLEETATYSGSFKGTGALTATVIT
tara:strand:- start:2586 stop:2996 length:411 start_codon:yes stop_codon:yes gene_type:complete